MKFYRKVFLVFMAMSFLFCARLCLASGLLPKSATDAEYSQSPEVDSSVCLVCGSQIDKNTHQTMKYLDKTYNFCGPYCVEIFSKNPAKYLKKINKTQSKIFYEGGTKPEDIYSSPGAPQEIAPAKQEEQGALPEGGEINKTLENSVKKRYNR